MRYLKLLLLIVLIALPVSAYAEKAKTIDDLAKMYDSSSCKSCHEQIYKEWEASMHSRSLFGSKRTMGGFKGMIEAGLMKAYTKSGVKEIKDIKAEHFAQCFKCHLPQIKDATDEVAQQIAKAFIDGDKATLLKVNINCVVCHNAKAIIHKWQDGEPEVGMVYGTKDMESPHKVKKSAIMTDPVACGQCHGSGPNLEFPQPSQCGTAFGSYQHAYIPSGGDDTCQDCHMRKSGKGHQMPAFSEEVMRKMAVDVNVDFKPYKFLVKAGDAIPMTVVTVRMTNHAGHRIPDG